MKALPTSNAAGCQSGSTLVITLMVLASVTILGVMGINVTCVELALSRNEREVQECFYLAEAAVLEGVQRLSDTVADDLNDHIQIWHHARKKEDPGLDFRKPEKWRTGEQDGNAMVSPLSPFSCFAAVEWDVAVGASLVVTDTRLYANRIYGLHKQPGTTDTIVEIGYYLRY